MPELPILSAARSEEMTEIIGKIPPYLIRRGIVFTALLFAFLFTAAWFLKYPTVIAAKITISSLTPPVKLVAKNTLPIQQLFVRNNENVDADQPLCMFNNAANYADVQQLVPITRKLDTAADLYGTLLAINLPEGLQLGELQSAYTDICQSIQHYRFFNAHNAYRATIGSLTTQVSYNAQLQAQLSNKEHMLQEELQLQHNRFAADSSLVKERIISPMEYQESKRRMLDQQMSSGNNRSSMIQNNLQEIAYQKDIAELTLNKQSEENNLQGHIREAIRRFIGQYAQWEQNYVIKTPIRGKVTFFTFWKENQVVAAGAGVMMVTPPVADFVVHGFIGADNNGKIKPGQDVLIKLPAYPFEEYGQLKGQITNRSTVSMDGYYALEIKLKNGLTTSSGKTIPIQPEMDATGEILTGNKSILERLFESVIGRFNRQ